MNVCFLFSSDVQYNVSVSIGSISGLPSISWKNGKREYEYECFIEASLFQKGQIIGLPITCSYKQFKSSWCDWNESIQFPVRVCDISRDAQLVFTIYAVSDTPNKHIIGGVTIPLFEQRILRFGHYKLRIKEEHAGDGSIDSNTLFTKQNRRITVRDQIQAKITEKSMKQIPKVAYLDSLTNRRLIKINQAKHVAHTELQIADNSDGIYLEIDLPNYGHKVVYQEKTNGKKSQIVRTQLKNSNNADIENVLLVLNDPEYKLTNPVLEKNNKLSQHLDVFDDHDHDIKPTVDEQKRLQEIVQLFDMSNVTESDKLLLWKFRKSLVEDKNALTKFLRIINQSNENEVEIAVNLMDSWAPIDISAALELLSGHFTCPQFRKYGIDVLRNASDQDLELYIMQLVQAVRYESFESVQRTQNRKRTILESSELESFLLDRCLASESFSLLNFLYWSVEVASQSEVDGTDAFRERYLLFLAKIQLECEKRRKDYWKELNRQKWLIGQLMKLSNYIGDVQGKVDEKKKKLRSTVKDGKFKELKEFKEGVLMPLRPQIRVTGIEGSECSVFRSAMAPLLIAFKFKKDDKFKSFEDAKDGNDDGDEGDDVDYDEQSNKKETDLKKKKKKRGQLTDLENDEFYKIIWKNGDDLRRDQLIIQMIHLMDNLLMEVNLDLCLTPYPVLATGLDHGMMEFVPSSPTIGGILEEYGNNITLYLEKMSNGKQQLLALYQDRFIKSLAGYCVITYLLGVGDRHLDNILLTKGGYLFHIDFGYIYGEEPPMKGTISPKIRIIKQMIAVMGGENSTKYKQFRQYIISAYLRLRKMAPLILNLLSLIGQGQMQQVDDDVRFVYTRFALEINEDLAANELLRIVEEAANSIWTHWMIDAPHNYATKHK